MQDRVGALETAVDDAVDQDLPPECSKMLRAIVFRTPLDVLRRGLLGDPPAGVEPMTVRLQPGKRAVRAKPRASPPAKAAWLQEHMANLETAGMVFRNSETIYGSVAMPIPKGFNSYHQRPDRTGGYAYAKPGRQSVSVRGRHRMLHVEYAARLLAGAAEQGCPRDVHHGHGGGVFTPRRVLAGVLNSTGYF